MSEIAEKIVRHKGKQLRLIAGAGESSAQAGMMARQCSGSMSRLIVVAASIVIMTSLWTAESMACGGRATSTAGDGIKVPKCGSSTMKKPVRREPRTFTDEKVKDLCKAIDSGSASQIHGRMDALIEHAGITNERWNNYHAFRVFCSGKSPLEYALAKEFSHFKAVADYGVVLDRPIADHYGGIATLKDYATHQSTNSSLKESERKKWQSILKYVTDRNTLGCADQTEIYCESRYPLAPPLQKPQPKPQD